MTTETQNQIIKQLKLRPVYTYPTYILHLLHTSWPDEIELIKAHSTARGVKAQIRDKNDNQVYGLEIYPEEQDNA